MTGSKTNYDEGKYGPIRNWSRGCFTRHAGMGDIFIGKNIDNEQLFLVKSVSREPVWSKQLTALQNEEQILTKLSKKKCPYIFRTLGNATSESVPELGGKPTMDLFLEFAIPWGNLADIIKRSGTLKESVAKAYTFQLLQALSSMHKNRIVHRDIRGVNIIVCERVVKLVGFGLAKDLSPRLKQQCSWSGPEKQPEIDSRPRPRPPQKSTKKQAIIFPLFECQEDISALGMLVCEMITGLRPKLDSSLPLDKAIRSLDVDFVKKGMLNCVSFIESCLEAKALGTSCWTADRLLTHPWIASMDQSSPDFSSDDEAATVSLTYPDNTPLLLKMDAITQTAAVSPRVMSLKKCAEKLCCRRMDTDNVIPPLSSRSVNGEQKTRKGSKLSRVLSIV